MFSYHFVEVETAYIRRLHSFYTHKQTPFGVSSACNFVGGTYCFVAGEMEFYRNHVLVQDVMAKREARHGGGNGGGSES